MRNIDTLLGTCLLVISIWIYYEALQFPTTLGNTLGTGFFPKLIAICLIILSLILIIFGKFKGKTFTINLNVLASTTFLFIVSVMYYLVMPRIGFLVTNTVFMLLVMYFFKQKKPLILILVPVISTLALYFIFKKLLYVPL